MDSLLELVWEIAEKKDTQLNIKLNKYLNRDEINDIVQDGGRFWIEMNSQDATMPKYIFTYIVKILTKQGYKYLYN